VTASVAARSAAREVSGAFEGVMGCTLCAGTMRCQLLRHAPWFAWRVHTFSA
jgi:hypothetical protein